MTSQTTYGVETWDKVHENGCELSTGFVGTGMGIHIAASKCPHVHAGVVESVSAALRAITGNDFKVEHLGDYPLKLETKQ